MYKILIVLIAIVGAYILSITQYNLIKRLESKAIHHVSEVSLDKNVIRESDRCDDSAKVFLTKFNKEWADMLSDCWSNVQYTNWQDSINQYEQNIEEAKDYSAKMLKDRHIIHPSSLQQFDSDYKENELNIKLYQLQLQIFELKLRLQGIQKNL
jgi:hypothetical protein